MKDYYKKINDFFSTTFNNFIKNEKVKKTYHFLTDCPTYKRTAFLALGYVFLFYLPFTILTLFFREVVFFQLDHLYQFSTIIFDFRNRVFDLNFSTWDFKNGLGYDYFANFYYIPLDFSLLPYFLFPFLSFSQQMWLSFLLKILVGTFAFSYLLKLYKLSNKTILFITVLYGASDLFFSQNVFPSYTGLIYYIPLILIAVELLVQKKNYLFFSFAIFQIFLFNSYWSFALTIFMSLVLLVRVSVHFLTMDNFYKSITYLKMIIFFSKSLFFYLLGFGLAAFFVFPILNIMVNEPRMTETGSFILKDALSFDKMVYYKTIFKMIVPNLYMYSGLFYDNTRSYWLPTNHVILYSSIMASFTLFFMIVTPSWKVKHKLTPKQFKTFILLKIVTILSLVFMFLPLTSYLFSMNTAGYLRYFVFYGVLLIINLAFIMEYKLFNINLFGIYLGLVIAYLAYSIYYNKNKDVYQSIFFDTDLSIAYTMIIVYAIILAFIVIFYNKVYLSIPLLIEKITFMSLIFSITVASFFSLGVKHPDYYGKSVNTIMKDNKLDLEYYTMIDALYYNDYYDYENMVDMPYLFDFPVYNNYNIFHSLINPYFTYYYPKETHERYYSSLTIPYFYYLYTDPSLFIQSESTKNGISNQFYPYDSELVGEKEFTELDSKLSIYKKTPQLSIGSGFTTYYNLENRYDYEFLWLDSIYVQDEDLINKLDDYGFKEEKVNLNEFLIPISIDTSDEYEMEHNDDLYYKATSVDIKQEDSNVVVLHMYYSSNINAVYALDGNGNLNRCYNTFCFVPESGITKLIVGSERKNISIFNIDFYTVNEEKISQKINNVKKYSTYDVEIEKNTITSKVNNDVPVVMQYKIGYAKGWEAYVDGKKVDTLKTQSGMVSFILEDTGTHEIILKYHTPWFKEGIIVSLISGGIFALALFTYIFKRRDYVKEQIKKNKLEEFSKFVVIGVLATLINYLVYILLQRLISPTISYTIGYIISFGFNFLASNVFTFKTKVDVRGGYRFLLAHLTNYFIQIILLNLFIFLQIPKVFAPIPVYFIAIPINFLTVRYALKK